MLADPYKGGSLKTVILHQDLGNREAPYLAEKCLNAITTFNNTWFSSDYLLPGATEGYLAKGCRRRLRQICDMPAAALIDLAEIHTGRGREGYGLRRKAGKKRERKEEALAVRWSFGERKSPATFCAALLNYFQLS